MTPYQKNRDNGWEQTQTTYSRIYESPVSPPPYSMPIAAQKLSANKPSLTKRYRSSMIFSLVLLAMITLILAPLMFFFDPRVGLFIATILTVLYYFAIRLYIHKE